MIRLLSIFLLISLLANSVLYLLYKNEKTSKQVILRENEQFKTQLNEVTAKYSDLQKLCTLDKQKIEKRYEALLQKAMQKPKTVEIPVIVEKPVYIEPEDCQRLGVMIDEAVSILNNSK